MVLMLGAGKILCILGGLLALVATFFLTLYNNTTFGIGSGYGIFLNFLNNVESGNILVIILTIVFVISVISGVFILIGIKSRVSAIIGSIFALFLAILLLIGPVLQINPGADINTALESFVTDPFIDGIFPFDLPIGLGDASLGMPLLLAGGVLGLIGGILGSSNLD